jgi:phenol hydroxylase P1 protein
MELNIANVEIEPKRHTFGHIARRFGEDRPASRYEEAVYDGQATENFHYKPLWEPEFEMYDVNRTIIKMDDWYKLLDPRKFHYMTYVSTRAKENAASQQSFDFVEKNALANKIDKETKEKIYKYLAPLRHYEYGANLNNLNIVARGYGTAFNSAALFYASDSLAMAQHVTKTILTISNNDTSILDSAKDIWMDDIDWQPLRELMENTMVLKDPIELLIAQNVALDGMVIPLLVKEFSTELAKSGDYTLQMLVDFIFSWQEDTTKWLDSIIKVMADESEDNKEQLSKWSKEYIDKTKVALTPLSKFSTNKELLGEIEQNLIDRLNKSGLKIFGLEV